jgi:hypothetical protein
MPADDIRETYIPQTEWCQHPFMFTETDGDDNPIGQCVTHVYCDINDWYQWWLGCQFAIDLWEESGGTLEPCIYDQDFEVKTYTYDPTINYVPVDYQIPPSCDNPLDTINDHWNNEPRRTESYVELPSGDCVWMNCGAGTCPYPLCNEDT